MLSAEGKATLLGDLEREFRSTAPAQLLRSGEDGWLNEAVAHAAECIECYLAQSKICQVDLRSRTEEGRLQNRGAQDSSLEALLGVVVTEDRPFISTTLHSIVEQFGETVFFLHPLISVGSTRLSVAYFSLGPLHHHNLADLRDRLEVAVGILRYCTDDLSKMRRIASNCQPLVEHDGSMFLDWLLSEGLVILGVSRLSLGRAGFSAAQSGGLYQLLDSASKGRKDAEMTWRDLSRLSKEILEDCQNLQRCKQRYQISITSVASPIHRPVALVHFLFKLSESAELELNSAILDEEESVDTGGTRVTDHSEYLSIVGTFTTIGRFKESSQLPLLSRVFEDLIRELKIVRQSHNYKFLKSVFDGMPKGLLLSSSLGQLRELVRPLLGVDNRLRTRLAVASEGALRGSYMLVSLDSMRLSPEVEQWVEDAVCAEFGVERGRLQVFRDTQGKSPARLYYYVPGICPVAKQLTALESEVEQLTQTWLERVAAAVRSGPERALLLRYEESFSEQYRATTSVASTLADLAVLPELSASTVLRTHLQLLEDEVDNKQLLSAGEDAKSPTYLLSILKLGQYLTISWALPILENIGVEVLSESSVQIEHPVEGRMHIHRFKVRPKEGRAIDQQRFTAVIAPALEQLFLGLAESDPLTSLTLSEGLDLKAVAVLRAYCLLLWQARSEAAKPTIYRALAAHSSAARLLYERFVVQFDPDLKLSREERKEESDRLSRNFFEIVRAVSNISYDRVLRSLHHLISATVRTNFFRDPSWYLGSSEPQEPLKSAPVPIALKIASQQVSIFPQPRPLFETFVYSPAVEGVHLRSGKVSRGGIRWSSRPEDYRSEVLGLMKTQRVKNALIVPTGAKGGFVIRGREDGAATPAEVESAYRIYIRSLLSLADRKEVDGSVSHPDRVVVHDEVDPYLVVAADRGTATFSDLANRIAQTEFASWLGDAFASGGGNGYDHKKLGITARGVWECVKEHLRQLAINPDTDPISVIGIGDMSGDVFGNGLLLARNMRLLAAFDHRHIFIDPNPDLQKSFEERVRLFALPRSSWADYDGKLISSGGGVFPRLAKEITLTAEIRQVLGIAESEPAVVDGETLVRYCLQAPCDLLWNGGIGTYVKCSSETHAEVFDGTNDRVRVNANELRAKVVGEGGNLGLTQRARIEYAKHGGLSNTDAIDNAAGVHLSDREVNIKLVLNPLVANGRLGLEDRNQLLKDLTPDVVTAVLKANRHQGLAVGLSAKRSARRVEYFKRLIIYLNKLGYITRSLDALPDDDELDELIERRCGLDRPIVAPIMAGVKMWCQESLASSALCDDPVLEDVLLEYFPKLLVERFKSDVQNHPLRRNIIATQLSNRVIDAVGVTFIHRMCSQHSLTAPQVIRCVIAADMIVGARAVRDEIEGTAGSVTGEDYFSLLELVLEPLRDAASWLMTRHATLETLDSLVERYKQPFERLCQDAHKLIRGHALESFQQREAEYLKAGLSPAGSRKLALLPHIASMLEVCWAASDSSQDVSIMAQLYTGVVESLILAPVFAAESSFEALDKWQGELLSHSYDQLRVGASKIAIDLALVKGCTSYEQTLAELNKHETVSTFCELVREFIDTGSRIQALPILAHHLNRVVLL